MSIRDTWRLGFVQMIYSPPQEIRDAKDPILSLKWHMDKTKELGGGAVQFGFPIPWDDKSLNEVKDYMAKTDIELELGAPVYGMFGPGPESSLISGDKAKIRAAIDEQVKAAHFLGVKILRGAYGKLRVKYSRFNKDFPLAEHKKFLVNNLKEVAKIMEDNDLYFAQENHCDFTGKEFAEDIFGPVGSKHIGCTLDTSNGYTIFSDANVDNEYLAPWALTTHMKDMKIEDFHLDGYDLPMFQARGCAVGDGNVDIARALDLVEQYSPMRNGLHVVIEQGWMNYDNVTDRDAYQKECCHKGLAYLKNLLGRA